jgi:hypothetical protein
MYHAVVAWDWGGHRGGSSPVQPRIHCPEEAAGTDVVCDALRVASTTQSLLRHHVIHQAH